jgi:hypothetical protein
VARTVWCRLGCNGTEASDANDDAAERRSRAHAADAAGQHIMPAVDRAGKDLDRAIHANVEI